MRKPTHEEWSHWLSIERVRLWQAVALSLDIDPKQGKANAFYDDFIRDIKYDRDRTLHVKFTNRLETAEAHTRSERLEVCDYSTSLQHSEVDLAKFANWADGIVKWETPDQFNELLSGAMPATEFGFDPESPVYPELLHIAVSAWSSVSPSPVDDQTPKQQIIAWLQRKHPALSDADKERIGSICNWDRAGGRPKTSER